MKFRSSTLMLMLIVVIGLSLGVFLISSKNAQAQVSDVLINECMPNPFSGGDWIELFNTTDNPIDLADWVLSVQDTGGTSNMLLSMLLDVSSIPGHGIVVVPLSGSLPDAGAGLVLLDPDATPIYSVSYGDVTMASEPHLAAPVQGDSLFIPDPTSPLSWDVTSSPTKGWFNDAGSPGRAPLLSDIDSALSIDGIETNIGELDDPSATPATEGAGALYFEKAGMGKIVFEEVLNMSDQSTVAVLQSLGTAMEMSGGHIKFDSATAAAMDATGAKIYMYGLPYADTPHIIIRDDTGALLGNNDPTMVGNISYDSGMGTLSFTAAHFTQFDSSDEVAATITDTSATDITTSTATLNFTTDKDGTYYYLVYRAPSGGMLGGFPNAAKVKAQGNAVAKGTGSALTGVTSVGITGLSAATGYNIYVIVEDAVGNISLVSKVPFLSGLTDTYVDDDYFDADNDGGHTWGVDAFATIQEGIDAVATGGTVNVASGNYNENLNINKTISLIGDIGLDEVGAGSGAPYLYDNLGNTRTVNIMASGVTIRGFIVENAGACSPSSSCYPAIRIGPGIASTTIKNNYLGNAFSGITLSQDSHDNIIAKNSIYSNYEGIFMNGSVSNAFSENEIYNNSHNGINVVSNRTAGGNNFISNNIHGNSYHGIYLGSYLDNTLGDISVSSNTISSNSGVGVYIDEATSQISIENNTISGNYYGIYSIGAINNTISNNEINNSISNGIEFEGNKIAGGYNIDSNNIHDNGNHGINLGGYLDTSDGLISIDSNTISLNQGAGIYINEGTSDVSIENNTISGNGHLTVSTGIHVISATGNSAHNNIISDDDQDTAINNEDVGNIFDATNNYWGSDKGPYSDINNPEGNANAGIVGLVKFRPYFTDEAMTTTSTVSVDSSNIAALFGNGGTFSVPDGETSTAATQLNVDEETIISVGEAAGTSTVVLPAGITITKTNATGTIDASLITASDVAASDLSGLTAGLVVEGAFQWGIPNLGLTFSSPITLNIYVGTALNGQTLTIYRSLSQSSGWETSGIVAPGTCVVASGICTFQTTKASYFAAAQSGSTGGGSSSGGGYAAIDYTFKTPTAGLSIKINNNNSATTARVVALDLYGGADAKNMAISNSADFANAVQDPYNTVKTWTLTEGNGVKTVYVKFYNQYGYSSAAVSDTITLSDQATDQTVSTPSETVLPPTNAISDSESAVVFSRISTASIQPGTMLNYTYSFKNNTAKTAKLKITRQMLNNKKKVVFTTSASKNIKAGESFNRTVNQMISKYSVPGNYWIKVKVTDLTNNKTYENSFRITIEKLKKKYFMMDGVETSTGPLLFNPSSLKRIKSNRALATYVGYSYSYINSTDKTQVLKLSSDIISPSGKELYSKSSKVILLSGKKALKSTSQYLGLKLAAGKYKIRIRATDLNTKEILAENLFNFSIDLK